MEFILHVLILLSVISVGLYVSIIIHEFGHLICGRLTGYQFLSFRLLRWQWTKMNNGKIAFEKGPDLAGIAGQCLMKPNHANTNEFRFILYNAGGSLANFLTGVIFCIPLFFITNSFAIVAYLSAAFVSFFFAGLNLIPLVMGGIPTDGKNIAEALQSPHAKHAFYMIMKMNAEMSTGKLLSDYDEESFVVDDDADVNNYFVAMLIFLHASWLEACHAYEESYQKLLQLRPDKYPPFYSVQIICALMFHELVYFGDEEAQRHAKKRINAKVDDQLFQRILTMEHPAFMPFYAAKVAFIDGNTTSAQALIKRCREKIPTLQNIGLEHAATQMLNRLEERLEDDCTN